MPYKFPVVDFDWLGKLPQVAEEANIKRTRRETLADLQGGSADELVTAGTKLLRAGDFEGGQKLLAEGRARKGVDLRGVADAQNAAFMAAYMKGAFKPPGAAASVPETTVEIPPPQPPAAPQAPSMVPPPAAFPPSPFSPRTEAPPASPSDEMITAAQGGLPQTPPPGPQLAGPPQAPGPATQALPEVVVKPGLQPGSGALPTGAPPQGPTPRPRAPMTESPEAAARAEAVQASNALIALGSKGMTTPAGRAYFSQFSEALKRANIGEKELTYQQELLRTRLEGRPDITRADHEGSLKTVGERVQSTLKTYAGYQERGQQASALGDKLVRMRQIMDNPRFAPGDPGVIDAARNYFGSIVDTFRAIGVPDELLPSREFVQGLTEPNALREAFASLGNQSVITALGTLSRTTDRDINYLTTAFPSLSKTKEGVELIHQTLTDMANRGKLEVVAAREYGDEKGVRGTPYGMDAAVDARMKKYAEDNPIFVGKDGKLTAKGKEVEAIAGPMPGSVLRPAQVDPRMITPEHEGKIFYDRQGRPAGRIKNGRPVPLEDGGL